MLELRPITTYYGPNPYAPSPVIVVDAQIPGDLTSRIEPLCESLRTHFPEWLDRLGQPGTSAAVALGETLSSWALGALNEVRGYLDAAGARSWPGGVRIWLGFHDERISQAALQLAVRALTLADRPDFSQEAMQRDLTALWQHCGQTHPDLQAKILMQAAQAKNVPVRSFIDGTKYWQYGWGNRSKVFFECSPNDNGGRRLGGKILGKAIFNDLGAPTPIHHLAQNRGELDLAARTVGWPCVVKPPQGGQGRGVTAGIQSAEELRAAFDEARRFTQDPVMVEAFVPGHDHRLMVAEKQFIRAIRREPSFLVGDGTHTIIQLVEGINRTRTINLIKSRYLRPIPVDDALRNHLAAQGLTVDSVLPQGARITLRSNANTSTGGIAIDVTEAVHPDTARMAELITQSMGLVTAGLDYITTDIGASFLEVGAFIEINANPGLRTLMAAGNDPVTIGTLALGEKPGRIPLTLVVMPGQELPEAARWLQSQRWMSDAAWACGRNAAIGGVQLKLSQSKPWPAVDAVLKHQAVASVWLFCSDQDLVLGGLPVDRADRILLHDVNLPDEWNAVLRRHAAHVDRVSDWRRAVATEAGTTWEMAAGGNRDRASLFQQN